ncbi:MAG: hypothetical protein K1V96_08715 [Lachnospiraceae bacterium]
MAEKTDKRQKKMSGSWKRFNKKQLKTTLEQLNSSVIPVTIRIRGSVRKISLEFNNRTSRVEPRIFTSHALPEGGAWDFFFYRKPRKRLCIFL